MDTLWHRSGDIFLGDDLPLYLEADIYRLDVFYPDHGLGYHHGSSGNSILSWFHRDRAADEITGEESAGKKAGSGGLHLLDQASAL